MAAKLVDYFKTYRHDINAWVVLLRDSTVRSMCGYNNYTAINLGMGSAPDSKVHGANMGPIWGRQDPGGPHVGPMNFAIWGYWETTLMSSFIGWAHT